MSVEFLGVRFYRGRAAVSDDAYGATVAKRRLARRLTELRLNTGYTANHVCDILNWGRGKVGRFEANQWKRPEMSDIRDLLRIYEVEDAVRQEIEDLATRSRARPWWRDYGEIFDDDFPGYENDATYIRVYMPLVLPGLLQTQAYMEALLKTGPRSPAFRRKAAQARLRRQEILDRPEPAAPRLSAVITEASLLYRWGMHGDRREQIEHLAEMSRRRTIELRIQRFDDGPPTGIYSMVNIFDFPDDEPPLVFVENDYAVEEVSKEEPVKGYIQSFERAADAALEPADTTVYLDKLTKRME
jgi:transcriptional regulator with XRE-family HTH domain